MKKIFDFNGNKEMKEMVINEKTTTESLIHLTPAALKELILKYYANETVTALKKKYRITRSKHTIVKAFPTVSFSNCRMCDKPIWSRLLVRERKNIISFEEELWCHACKHQENSSICQCENETCTKERIFQKEEIRRLQEEEERRKQERDKKREEERRKLKEVQQKIRDEMEQRGLGREGMEIDDQKVKIEHNEITIEIINDFTIGGGGKLKNENELSLNERLILGAFIRGTQLEGTTDLQIPLMNKYLITPTLDFFDQMLDYLIKNQLISPSRSTALTECSINQYDEVSFNKMMIRYRVNVIPSHSYKNMVQNLIFPKSEDFLKDREFCQEIWCKIAVGEVMADLDLSLEKKNIVYSPRKVHQQVFEYLINYFSINQIYNITNNAGNRLSTKLIEGTIHPSDAADSMIMHIENYGLKAIREKWDVKPFYRQTRESILTKMIFNNVLTIGDAGYKEVARKYFQ
ncbi:hypothetical protein [Planomicrobium sp. Y74]|uniref:hypothetical protein n=1 Tax=Planomicrobium sp. Y74 TaxID=2478977 RepID=UPI000EF5133A|nr:hypothetical protein [Planomicrobium sp. Y74]RLQ84871.1 hypothetical protein D9754_16485 [Planomicrobium sp. Y74]